MSIWTSYRHNTDQFAYTVIVGICLIIYTFFSLMILDNLHGIIMLENTVTNNSYNGITQINKMQWYTMYIIWTQYLSKCVNALLVKSIKLSLKSSKIIIKRIKTRFKFQNWTLKNPRNLHPLYTRTSFFVWKSIILWRKFESLATLILIAWPRVIIW